MKARLFKKISLGLVLSILPLVGACNQQNSNVAPSLVTTAQAEPLAATNTNSATLAREPVALEATPSPDSAPVPTPAPNSGKALPPNINPSSPVGEVVRLAQAGVDETVMLSYVNNATSLFNLASDEIIYLNDIGVPDRVVTAMIQHDQTLKQAGQAATQANASVAEAAAPTYVDPPQPEAQPAPAEGPPLQPPANVTYSYFNDSLSPYGSWIDIEGYGRCWQPTVVVVNPGWQPYCDRGRWLYTDAGWYWNSDYSWGWAAFHYGRWFNHTRLGWCWYPDYVWGPSWVSWRYSDAYCGWAPLPPAACYSPGFGFSYYNSSVGFNFGFGLSAGCYTFVPWGSFCDNRPWHHRVPPGHASEIYNHSTVVNNVTGDHNRIINHGIPIDSVRRHAGREIRQVAIRETSAAAGFGTRGERLERDGRTLVVHRPNLPQTTTGSATSPSFARDLRAGHQPAAGAGAAAQMENLSGPRRGKVEDTRNRTISQPAPAVSGNARTTPSPARPTPSRDTTTHSHDAPPNNPPRDPGRDNNRSATTPPLIVRGGQNASITFPTQKVPPGSLVVIGRRDSNPSQNQTLDNERRPTSARTEAPARAAQTWSATQPAPTSQPAIAAPRVNTPQGSSPPPTASLSYNRPATQTPRFEQYEAARQAAPLPRPQASAPTYSAPRPTPAPSYSAPIHSAPRSTPTPSYSAPHSSPAPAPSYSPAPARAPAAAPAQDRSPSGRDGSSGRNRD